ncbi:MAG: sugar transferase [Flavobacteriales bacterium]|nr:sugar transferase [Flavobacteriales bacterium]
MNKALQRLKYVLADILSAVLSWSCFYVFRKLYVEPQKFGYDVGVQFDTNFYRAIIFIPLFWVFLYALTGYYNNPYRKSRLRELIQTVLISSVGTIIIFFALLLDDQIPENNKTYFYYILVGTLFGIHLVITYVFRFILSTRTVKRIHNRKIGFRTLMVGSNENALRLYEELQSMHKSLGFKFEGFVHLKKKKNFLLSEHMKNLGSVDKVRDIILDRNIEETIIALESSEHDEIGKIMNNIRGTNVGVKIIPDMYDILSGQVKMNAIFGVPLIDVNHEIMPVWQQVLKRVFDVTVSVAVLVVFSWMYLIIALFVKLSSPGPVIYSHERIGKYGKPFKIYKFRTMRADAEKNGPSLSSEEDPRITKFGKFLRRTRMDEMPQFFNVLIGEMSIVGPRPERQYFINQIIQRAPHYLYLHKVRPGITSWGQVKYGYAENVDQMIQRLKYDVLYIENMSLVVDLKILIYTVLIVLQSRGK